MKLHRLARQKTVVYFFDENLGTVKAQKVVSKKQDRGKGTLKHRYKADLHNAQLSRHDRKVVYRIFNTGAVSQRIGIKYD